MLLLFPNGEGWPCSHAFVLFPLTARYGICVSNGSYVIPFSIVDQVQVPVNITEGQYVLSFRYDAEQTPQVWNTCANINVV